MNTPAQIGVIGMAVMGRNLALNIADHDFSVAVWNRSPVLAQEAVAQSKGRLHGTASLEELVQSLERPRKLLLMIKAGKPVDAVLKQLVPLLEPGDIIIDGGNSWFQDTRRREQEMAAAGLRFFGVGISGGEDGARYGPSLMPGGDPEAYLRIAPIFEAIAARSDSGPCVTHIGSDGAGHFVKMVHNGIEYADMQFIAEAYHMLRELLGLEPPQIAEVFRSWNQGLLESYLIEISAEIMAKPDDKEGATKNSWLIDKVLDKAGQKGTGRWTAQVALDLGVPIPSIAAAIDARLLSSMKAERVRNNEVLQGPSSASSAASITVDELRDALYASKVAAYAQGMTLIRAGARNYGWDIDYKEVARIWKGGCIIRARFLDTMMHAWERNPELRNLLVDEEIRKRVQSTQADWRRVVAAGIQEGIPMPGMSASLAYYDSLRSAALPQNLVQAQRDAFGAHTYQRTEDPDGPFVHSDWLTDPS